MASLTPPSVEGPLGSPPFEKPSISQVRRRLSTFTADQYYFIGQKFPSFKLFFLWNNLTI